MSIAQLTALFAAADETDTLTSLLDIKDEKVKAQIQAIYDSAVSTEVKKGNLKKMVATPPGKTIFHVTCFERHNYILFLLIGI